MANDQGPVVLDWDEAGDDEGGFPLLDDGVYHAVVHDTQVRQAKKFNAKGVKNWMTLWTFKIKPGEEGAGRLLSTNFVHVPVGLRRMKRLLTELDYPSEKMTGGNPVEKALVKGKDVVLEVSNDGKYNQIDSVHAADLVADADASELEL